MLQKIIEIFLNIADWLVSLFPTIEIPIDIVNSINTVFHYLYNISAIIPFSTLYFCLQLYVGINTLLMGYGVLKMLFRR